MTEYCQKEWLTALLRCHDLLNLPEFHMDRKALRGQKNMGSCAMGLVSAACGGNPV